MLKIIESLLIKFAPYFVYLIIFILILIILFRIRHKYNFYLLILLNFILFIVFIMSPKDNMNPIVFENPKCSISLRLPKYIDPNIRNEIVLEVQNKTSKDLYILFKVLNPKKLFFFTPIESVYPVNFECDAFDIMNTEIKPGKSIEKTVFLYTTKLDLEKIDIPIKYKFSPKWESAQFTLFKFTPPAQGIDKNIQALITIITSILAFIYFLLDKMKNKS